MGIGYAIGDIIAYRRHMSCPWLFGLLTGLLFSIHIYKKGLIILVDEYKRLKSKNKDENIFKSFTHPKTRCVSQTMKLTKYHRESRGNNFASQL